MDKPRTSPPSVSFLFSHPAHLIACGMGSGLSPVAPGTVGTLFAWVSFYCLRLWIPDLFFIPILIISFLIGILAIHKTGKDLGVTDHGSIVWDEIVPFWLVLWFCPAGFLWQVSAFAAFRFFDIVKPQPARYFDQKVKNGFGVMMDDVIAALYSILFLALVRYFS